MLLTFWATFFVFYDPLDFSTGICPTPTRQKVGKTQLCADGACNTAASDPYENIESVMVTLLLGHIGMSHYSFRIL